MTYKDLQILESRGLLASGQIYLTDLKERYLAVSTGKLKRLYGYESTSSNTIEQEVSNIQKQLSGINITVSSTEPLNPNINDIWIEIP